MKKKTFPNSHQYTEGSISLEYRDPITGKIKERITGKNITFPESFDGLAWRSWLDLENGTTPTFFITDGDTPADPNFPYLPGNILGWGAPGLNMSGSYQGQYVATDSYKARVLDGGRQTSWRYTYDFYPHQITSAIKSFGLTAQYQSLYGHNTPIYPTQRFSYNNTRNAHWLVVDQTAYRFASASNAALTILNVLEDTSIQLDLSSKLEAIAGCTFCIGLNFLTGTPYILAYNATAAYRRVYEFSDLTFESVSRVWTPTNLAAYPSTSYVFWVDSNYNYYYWNSNVYRGNFDTNVNAAVISDFLPACPYNAGYSSGQIGSLIAKEGKLFIISEYYSTSSVRHPIIDLETMTYWGSMTAVNRASSTTYGAVLCADPAKKTRPILISNYAGLYYVYKQAFTHYNVPADAPPRPDNTVARISYQVDIFYSFEE